MQIRLRMITLQGAIEKSPSQRNYVGSNRVVYREQIRYLFKMQL